MAGISLSHLLNVRREERWIVNKLFWMQFFQGAGIAFFFTSAYATFLSKHSIDELSIVYAYTAVFLWITGFIYSRLEHRTLITKLSRQIVFFMAGSILIERIFGFSGKIPGFDYFMLIWLNVLYLLHNLQFWGIAAHIFEVRQSKRLFSIISAGDIPAKFIGYSLASLVVGYVGTANLLIASFVSMVLSIPFLNEIIRSGALDSREETSTHLHKAATSSSWHLPSFIKKFTGNQLILLVAILSFIMSVCLVVTNFAFYGKIKEAFPNDIELAKFIGGFLAIVRLSALLVKLLATSRIISRLGIKRSMMFTPSVFIVLIIFVIILQHLSNNQHTILFAFGITCIILDILKTSIDSPVFLSIMQPLTLHDRLRAHNIVKGIMDSFAYLFTALFLFILIELQGGIHLLTLSYCLVVFTMCWIFTIHLVNREYHQTVLTAISSKFYTNTDFVIDDNDTLTYIKNKLETGTAEEIIHILKLAHFQRADVIDEALASKLLLHSSDKVKEEVLDLSASKEIALPEMAMLQLIKDEKLHPDLHYKAFQILCDSGKQEDIIYSYVSHNDPQLRMYATACILKNENSSYYNHCTEIVKALVRSESSADRITGARIIGRAKAKRYRDHLIQLMSDADPNVQSVAIVAAGKIGGDKLIIEILHHFTNNRNAVADAILAAGEEAIPFLNACILSTSTNHEEKKQLITLCGRIGGEAAGIALMSMLMHLPELDHIILKALFNAVGKLNPGEEQQLEDYAQRWINEASEILFMQKKLLTENHPYQLLKDALNIQLMQLRESLLYVFSILYDASEIAKVRSSITLRKKERLANALELVELKVHKKFAHDFTIIYDTGDIEHRCSQLHNRSGSHIRHIDEIMDIILRSKEVYHQEWTKSCALYMAKKNNIGINPAVIKKYSLAEHPVLRESALFYMNTFMENKLLLLEKVLILKRTAIFAETPENILADLAPLMQEVVYAEGDVIFKEDSIGDSMYIIYQGSVRIHKGNTTLAILNKESDVFGELSLFDAEKRSATATADADSFIFKIDQHPFYELIEIRPEILKGAVKILCKRLRAQNEMTVEMINK